MDGGCHKLARTYQSTGVHTRVLTHTHLIPNKHHEVIMCNLSIALFSCSAWLSRQHSVVMQTQAADSMEAKCYYYTTDNRL